MGEENIRHFLVIYDIKAQLADVVPFEQDYDAAIAAYDEAERDYEDRDGFDIVLLGADSLETIKRTHSSYFETKTFERFLPEGVLVR